MRSHRMTHHSTRRAWSQVLAGLMMYLMAVVPVFGQASLMPNARQQFLDADGNPLASGTVDFYTPNTQTRKNTWQNAAQSILNANPVQLDSGGWATIYGSGSYRQVVKDVNGEEIWDSITASTATSGATAGAGDGLALGSILPYAGIAAPTGYVFAYGQAIARATYPNFFTAVTISSSTATCTNASPNIGGFASTEQVRVGSAIEASCIAPGTTVKSIISATTIEASANASSSTTTTAVIFPYGNGNGSTTFNVPDLRGRYLPGRDNMGGSAASRITSTYYGASPAALGVTGGNQSTTLLTANLPAYTPSGTIGITDPGHTHTLTGVIGTVTNLLSLNNIAGPTGTSTNPTTNSNTTGITAAFTGAAQGGVSTAFSNLPISITTNYIIKIETNGGSSVVASLGSMTGSVTCGAGLVCGGGAINTTNLSTVTVSGLPTCNSDMRGGLYTVSDSDTVVWGTAIAGGSSNVALAFCNGTSWTVAGK